MLDPDDPETLVLGPFRGVPTEHVRILVSQGICGAALAQNDTVIVDDVHSDPRYLACSLETHASALLDQHQVVSTAGNLSGIPPFSSHDFDLIPCGENATFRPRAVDWPPKGCRESIVAAQKRFEEEHQPWSG